jgi:enamine deaminase RidA (YjgF/YER057c/UK114 family)
VTGEIAERLAALGLSLPAPPPPIANFVGAVTAGDLVFVSGHGPYRDAEYQYLGKVDSEVPLDDAYQAARLTMINLLASLQAEIGSLDRVVQIVKLLGMVNSDPTFKSQPQVINGASDLLVELFGGRGRHARSAVGMAGLPGGISVEIEMVVQISASNDLKPVENDFGR